MRAKQYSDGRNQFIEDRNEALLSMDRDKILAFARKYNGDDGYEQEDEYVFWISVHKMRTASLGLPESERRVSMNWLIERGYEHYASDLTEKDKSLAFAGNTSFLVH